MDFNDPALEHLVNKITIALQENNRGSGEYLNEFYRIPNIDG